MTARLFRFRRRLATVIVALTVLSTACASLPAIPNLPEQVPGAETQALAAAGNLQQLLTMAAQVLNDISQIEDTAARAGAVPANLDAQFDRLAVAYANASDAAVQGLTSGMTRTWPELRAMVEPVLVRGQQLIEMAGAIGAIKSRVATFLAQLRDLLSAAAGEFLFGGAR